MLIRTAARLAMLRLQLTWTVPRRALPAILARLDRPRAGATLDREGLALAVRITEAAFSRLRLPSTCLYRALARYALLRRAGRDVRFLIGVRRGADHAVTGHAWVEERTPGDALGLDEARAPDLTVLFVYPSDGDR